MARWSARCDPPEGRSPCWFSVLIRFQTEGISCQDPSLPECKLLRVRGKNIGRAITIRKNRLIRHRSKLPFSQADSKFGQLPKSAWLLTRVAGLGFGYS